MFSVYKIICAWIRDQIAKYILTAVDSPALIVMY